MLTREVTLQTGLLIGDERATLATVREETLGDELDALGSGKEGLYAHRHVMMRRVVRLGPLEPPAREMLAKLTRTDWELIERAMAAMDLERAVEAGIVKPEAARETGAGRGEPGGAAPGDA